MEALSLVFIITEMGNFFMQITTSKKYNLNSPVVRRGLKEALSACDTVRFPSLYIEYNERFHYDKVKNRLS